MKAVVLMGGGIDSTTLLVWLKKNKPAIELTAFHVDYGQKAYESESGSVDYFCNKYDVPLEFMDCDLRFVANSAILRGTLLGKTQTENKLEGRNVILISLAATFARTIGADSIYLGFHKEPKEAPFPDATMHTVELMRDVLAYSYGQPPIAVVAPFSDLSRLEVFKKGLELDPEIETETFTCYEDEGEECGVCVHCQTKKEMLEQLKCVG